MKYSEHIKKLNSILHKLQTCEDVDEAVDLYQSGCEHLQKCKDKIEKAKGKFELLKNEENSVKSN